MFSLNDEITKFQVLASTLKDDIMAIDEKFLGGGFTMKDLIQQNSFIMSEMRKMKEVFLSYCKLNDKIYKKIIEHQISASEHERKLGSILPTVDRKLQYFTIEVSKLKELTVVQIHKNKERVDHQIDSVKKIIGTRVDEKGFDERVSKLIEKFDDECQEHKKGKGRWGLTRQNVEQILRIQINPLLNKSENRISELNKKSDQMNDRLTGIGPRFKKIEQNAQWVSQDLVEIKKAIKQNERIAEVGDQKILNQLNSKINDDIWASQFQNFNSKYVRQPMSALRTELTKNSKQIEGKFKDVETRFSKFTEKLDNQQSKLEGFEEEMKRQRESLNKCESHIAITREQLKKSMAENDHHRKEEEQKTLKLMEQLQQKIKRKNIQIEIQIKNIIEGTRQQVLSKVIEQFSTEIKMFRSKLESFEHKFFDSSQKIEHHSEILVHIKDLLAKKANFTDLVIHYDRKADREDLQQLRGTVREEGQKFRSLSVHKGQKDEKINEGTSKKVRNLSYRKSRPSSRYGQQKQKKFTMESLQFSQDIRTIPTNTQINRHQKTARPSTGKVEKSFFLL